MKHPKNGNSSEPSLDKNWGEGSDKRPSTQHLRPNLQPIYHLPGKDGSVNDDNEIDDEGRLHLAIVPTTLPCVSCGTPGPNLQWQLSGRIGVLCRRCLSAFVEEMNQSLGANDPVSGGYQAAEGDLYVQEVRPGWFNVHRFQSGAWEYVTVLQKQEADLLTAGLHLVGESQGIQGQCRYYREIVAPTNRSGLMMDAAEIALLLKAAIPIDDVDQILAPDLNFALIWIDISERPDLQMLAEQDTLADGYSICTYFYANTGKRNMRLGLRVEMRQPVHFVLPLVFKVSQYVDQLTTLSLDGNFWIVPGPRPAHMVGSTEMNTTTFIEQVIAYSGQGLFITLEDHMIVELRERLAEWKRLK